MDPQNWYSLTKNIKKEVFMPLEVNETHKHQIVYLLMVYGPCMSKHF